MLFTHQSVREVSATWWGNLSDVRLVICGGNPEALSKMGIWESVSVLAFHCRKCWFTDVCWGEHCEEQHSNSSGVFKTSLGNQVDPKVTQQWLLVLSFEQIRCSHFQDLHLKSCLICGWHKPFGLCSPLAVSWHRKNGCLKKRRMSPESLGELSNRSLKFSARVDTNSFIAGSSCIFSFSKCSRRRGKCNFLPWMSLSWRCSFDWRASIASYMSATVWFLPCSCRLRGFRWDMMSHKKLTSANTLASARQKFAGFWALQAG